jgi:hypothetical protein
VILLRNISIWINYCVVRYKFFQNFGAHPEKDFLATIFLGSLPSGFFVQLFIILFHPEYGDTVSLRNIGGPLTGLHGLTSENILHPRVTALRTTNSTIVQTFDWIPWTAGRCVPYRISHTQHSGIYPWASWDHTATLNTRAYILELREIITQTPLFGR